MTEVGPDADFTPVDNETLKAMPIAARTVAYKNCGLSLSNFPHDGIDDNIKQVYDPRNRETWLNSLSLGQAELDRYQQAIDDTAGMYLTYNNTVFDAQYRDKSDDSTDDYDEDGDGTIEPHKGIYDPAGKFHATPTYLTPGLMQVNANHWAIGENHGEALPNWNYQQILTHYYTGIHIRDENGTIITPDYRWNPLKVDWNGSTTPPDVITPAQSYPVTLYLQNTGVVAWGDNIELAYYWLQNDTVIGNVSLYDVDNLGLGEGDETNGNLTLTLDVPSELETGQPASLVFDLRNADDPAGDYFSNREADSGKAWFALSYHFCMGGACSLYLPTLLKNYPLPQDTYESNDDFAEAYRIYPTIEYHSYIWSGTDEDFFKVNVSVPPGEARFIDVWLTSIPANTNYDLALYQPDETLLLTSTESGNNDEHIRQWVNEGGYYYVKIDAPDSSFSQSDRYSLMVEVSQAPVREIEP